jgi:precorrin-6B methylase 1
VQTAFARVGLDWQDARIVSAHGSLPDAEMDTFAGQDKIAVLAGGEASRAWIRALVRFLGNGYGIIVCSDLTLENERVQSIDQARLDTVPLPSRSIVLFIKKEILA